MSKSAPHRMTQAPERRFGHSAFLSGRPTDYSPFVPNHSFCYADDTWIPLELAKPNERLSAVTLRFTRMPGWLKQDAKRWASSAWLEQSKSAGYIATTLAVLTKHVGAVVTDFEGESIMCLTEKHASEVRQRLSEAVRNGDLAISTAYQTVSRIMAVVRYIRKLPDNSGRACKFRLTPVSSWRKHNAQLPLSTNPEKVIPLDVAQKLLLACERESEVLEELLAFEAGLVQPNGRPLSPYLRRKTGVARPHPISTMEARNRAIKAQAIVLSLLAGRRSVSITLLPRVPKVEETIANGLPILKISFAETKINDFDEAVVIPTEAKEIALTALRRAREYSSIFCEGPRAPAEYLFVVKSNSAGVKLLGGTDLNEYLNGVTGKSKGLLPRAGITQGDVIAQITTHNFRTTRLTQIAEHAGVEHARQDAGHRNVLMTTQFYIAGSPKMMVLAEESLKAGAVTGEVADGVSGRAQAERVTPRLIKVMMTGAQPKAVNITRYGLCYLQAETGPCPTGNPCWMGIDPDAPQIRAGRGCEWQGLTPDALPALRHDEKMLDHQIGTYGADPRFAHFVPNLRERLAIIRKQISTAEELEQQRMEWRAANADDSTAG